MFLLCAEKTKLDSRCKKSIFVGYNKQSLAYLIYFPETTAIKRVCCVKFNDYFNNSLLTKQDKNIELPDYIVEGNGHGDTSSNLDETDCISHSTNTLGKGMNRIILPPAMGK